MRVICGYLRGGPREKGGPGVIAQKAYAETKKIRRF